MTADTDWLSPDPGSAAGSRPRTSSRVWRSDADGEQAAPFPTLIAATVEPPLSPEAEIRGKGGCLAMSHPDEACWVFTELGKQRIEREARGEEAA